MLNVKGVDCGEEDGYRGWMICCVGVHVVDEQWLLSDGQSVCICVCGAR